MPKVYGMDAVGVCPKCGKDAAHTKQTLKARTPHTQSKHLFLIVISAKLRKTLAFFEKIFKFLNGRRLSRRLLFYRRRAALRHYQLIIYAVPAHKLVVAAHFSQLAFVKDDKAVGAA